MLRVRGGDFHYSEREMEVMVEDAVDLAATSVEGIVFGALNENRAIDENACSRVLEAFGRPLACFHRAIDLTPDPTESVGIAARLGFARILTSGGGVTALDGIDTLRRMRDLDLIEIMPGGGIRTNNASAILEGTGCDQLHLAPFVNGRIDRSEVQRIRLLLGQTEGTA
jgi:copper homeostasis protein